MRGIVGSDKRLQTAFSALFALFMGIGFAVTNISTGRASIILGFFTIVFTTFIIFFWLFGCLLEKRYKIHVWLSSGCQRRFGKHLSALLECHPFAIPFALIVLCWTPYLIIYFPGIFMYDSTYELFQALGSGAIPAGTPTLPHDGMYSDHKPLSHILLLGVLFKTGSALGSQTLGIFLITLTQFLCMAAACAGVIYYLRRLGFRGRLRIVGLVFLCLFPAFPLYAVSAFNDCMAIGFFVMWVLFFFEIIRTDSKACSNVRFCLIMVAAGIIASLFKKPNMYIILACSLLLLIKYRKAFLPLLIQAFAPAFVMVVIMPLLVFPALQVVLGEKGEVLGTFLQQSVYYAITNENNTNEADTQHIEHVLDLEKAKAEFDPTTFDPVKYRFNINASTNDLLAYFGTYVKQGLSDPLAYAYAFFAIQHQWFYPNAHFDFYSVSYEAQISDLRERSGAYELADSLNYAAPLVLERPRETLGTTLYALSHIPIFAPFSSIALYATWIPLICMMLACSYRRRSWKAFFLPVIFSILVLFISPMMMCCYALPIVLLIPLMIGIAFSGKSTRTESAEPTNFPISEKE